MNLVLQKLREIMKNANFDCHNFLFLPPVLSNIQKISNNLFCKRKQWKSFFQTENERMNKQFKICRRFHCILQMKRKKEKEEWKGKENKRSPHERSINA